MWNMVKSQRMFIKNDIFPYLIKLSFYLFGTATFLLDNHTGTRFRLLPPKWSIYCVSKTLAYKINPIQMGKNTTLKEPNWLSFCSNSADGVNIQTQGSSQHGPVI